MLTKIGKILAIIGSGIIVAGGISRAAIDDYRIASNGSRIDTLEAEHKAESQARTDDHYMICYIFTQVKDGAVPASCNSALRISPK